ncbi:hypothetical protein ACLOJK_017873 [Asimina triloba]
MDNGYAHEFIIRRNFSFLLDALLKHVDSQMQEWPICVSYGAIAGYAIGIIAGWLALKESASSASLVLGKVL